MIFLEIFEMIKEQARLTYLLLSETEPHLNPKAIQSIQVWVSKATPSDLQFLKIFCLGSLERVLLSLSTKKSPEWARVIKGQFEWIINWYNQVPGRKERERVRSVSLWAAVHH